MRVFQFLLTIASLMMWSSMVQSETYFFHNDHLGTPQVVTDSSQQIVWKVDYQPFGTTNESVTSVTHNLRFPGQYYDRETELHYNYFRTYSPITGRYQQSDPSGLLGGVNTYSYVSGNPISKIDSLGLVETTVTATIKQAVKRGDIDDLELLFDLLHHGFSKSEKAEMIRQCKVNNQKIKAETLEVKDQEKRLYESTKRSEVDLKPKPRTKTQAVVEVIRSILRFL